MSTYAKFDTSRDVFWSWFMVIQSARDLERDVMRGGKFCIGENSEEENKMNFKVFNGFFWF